MISIKKFRERLPWEYSDEEIGTTYLFRILIGRFSFSIEFILYDESMT